MQEPLIFTLSVVAREDLYLDESKESLRYTKGSTCLFAIKKTTPLGRLKKSFCNKFNLYLASGDSKVNGVVFSFGCRTVQDGDTCETLKIRDKDTIWAHHSIEFHCPPLPPGTRTLAMDMKRLYLEGVLKADTTDSGFYRPDITFDVEGKKIHAHRLILSVRSEKMRAMFHFHELNNSEESQEIKINEHKPETFQQMLRWVYCDEIEENVDYGAAIDLLALADEMLLFPLKAKCERILMESINQTNAINLYICANAYHVDILKTKCKRFIIDNYDQIMEENPNFDTELCKVPELLLELTRAALSKKESFPAVPVSSYHHHPQPSYLHHHHHHPHAVFNPSSSLPDFALYPPTTTTTTTTTTTPFNSNGNNRGGLSVSDGDSDGPGGLANFQPLFRPSTSADVINHRPRKKAKNN